METVIKQQQIPTNWDEREILREKGQFWTPSWVAEAMLAYVCENTDLIFDPATGNGAFFEALLKLNKSHISFYGTDIDNRVLENDIYKHKSCTVENRDLCL
jgi:ubiquinone/menaquinone biosynthesis C-methylase UbiE